MGAQARLCVVMRLTAATAHAVNATIVERRTRRLRRSLIVSGMANSPRADASLIARIPPLSGFFLERPTSSDDVWHGVCGSIRCFPVVEPATKLWKS